MIKYSLAVICFFILNCSFAQPSMDVLKHYYPNTQEPGGILSQKKDGVMKMSSQGMAHLKENRAITSHTRFRMASVSKQFTAMAIYLLIKDNKISFETPLRTLFPELSSAYDPVKVKHLINHSSGLMDYENLIPNDQKNQLSDGDVLQLIQNQDSLYFTPGTQFRYSNTAYCLMSLIVERVSNLGYEVFCYENIFKRLNMTSAQISAPQTYENRAFGYRPKGNEFYFADQSITSATRGDGGVYIAAEDYLNWADRNNILFAADFYTDFEQQAMLVKDNVYYSMGWFYTKSDEGFLTMFHSGESTGFHNIVLFQPEPNRAYTLFTNRDDLRIAKIFDEVLSKENINLPSLSESLFLWLNNVYSGE